MVRKVGVGIRVCLVLLTLGGCQAKLDPVPTIAAARASEPAGHEKKPRADGLTSQQGRGREIYRHGSSTGGRPIRALLGQSREPVDAALLACANCHGQDGRGRPEGGIEPPDVTWRALSKPYGTTDRWGRPRPAYTESLLGRVVTMGLDAGGRRLDAAMPRYQLPAEDLADLVAYLAVIGGDLDPGLTPTSLAIGVLLPSDRLDPTWRHAVLGTLKAHADDVNRRGGLYNRNLVVVAEDLDPGRAGAGAAVAAFLDRRSVFALVAADIRGVDEEVVRIVEAKGVPLIGPFTLEPVIGSPPRRQVFYLHGGLEDQACAMATDASRSALTRPSAVIHSDDPASIRAAEAFAETWATAGRGGLERVAIPEAGGGEAPEALVARLAASKTEVVAYLGPRRSFGALLDAAGRASWRPVIYEPLALAVGDLFERASSFEGKVMLAFPYLPDDITRAGREEFARLRLDAGLSDRHRAARMAVLAAAKVFEEGVGRCGRELSRTRLVEELERLREFPTGFSRPVTYGPIRRVGAAGAYLLAVDPASGRMQRSGGWVDVGGSP